MGRWVGTNVVGECEDTHKTYAFNVKRGEKTESEEEERKKQKAKRSKAKQSEAKRSKQRVIREKRARKREPSTVWTPTMLCMYVQQHSVP